MNAIPTTPASERALHARRCVRHEEREAAVRCPGCARFFCRECVVEHDGRLLCTDCLARAAAASSKPPRDWARWRRAGALAAAVVVAWLIFYALGALLLRIPSTVHDAGRTAARHTP